MSEYKLFAPDVDSIVQRFEHGFRNPEQPSKELMAAMDPLFEALSDLAPCKANDEAKIIWFTVPRGTIENYGSFDEEEYNSYEEFEEEWRSFYPDELKWYRLTIGEGRGHYKFRSLAIDNTGIINADLADGLREETWWSEQLAIELCKLILPAVLQSMDLLRTGTYNEYVSTNLPYSHRIGVLKRNDEWKVFPEFKDRVWEEMDKETFRRFKNYLSSNSEDHIGRMPTFTANDFFRACCAGYKVK